MSKKKEKEERDDTTIRATVTPDEHEAIRWTCKHTFGGMTISDFVREAVDAHLTKYAGKSLEALSVSVKSMGKYVQGELF